MDSVALLPIPYDGRFGFDEHGVQVPYNGGYQFFFRLPCRDTVSIYYGPYTHAKLTTTAYIFTEIDEQGKEVYKRMLLTKENVKALLSLAFAAERKE